jgi:hypothetical protein
MAHLRAVQGVELQHEERGALPDRLDEAEEREEREPIPDINVDMVLNTPETLNPKKSRKQKVARDTWRFEKSIWHHPQTSQKYQI